MHNTTYSIKLLLVEDNPGDAYLVRSLLTATHVPITVAHVTRLSDAVSYLENDDEACDVVLLGLGLPDAQGATSIVQLRAMAPALPIIVFTGLDDEMLAMEALRAGADDYLVKGMEDGTMMLRAVRYAIERRRAHGLAARLGRILDESSNEIYIFNAATLRFIQANRSALRNLGYSMSELQNMTPLDLKPGYSLERFMAMMEPLYYGTQEVVVFESVHRRKDRTEYPVEVRLQYSRNEKPAIMFAIIQDITQRQESERQLVYLAQNDALTGLPNRLTLGQRLALTIEEANRYDRIVAVMFIDIDNFKVINDTLGHGAGDEMLVQVGARLSSVVRPGDMVARPGGDEFVVLLANVAHINDPARVAEKITRVFEAPFHIGGRELCITASIGVTVYPLDAQVPEELLKNADSAMYYAKAEGRNNFQFYTAEMNERAARRFVLESNLRNALAQHELYLHYQPLVDTATGSIIGAEALVRWVHPELGLVMPGEFIPLAEETGLIIDIGNWVLHAACVQNKIWHDAGHTLRMAVNISGRHLQYPTLLAMVTGALETSGLDSRWLELEVTETHLMQNIEYSARVLGKLSQAGVGISLDDFGTGYSSLTYLKRLPIDSLKIDRSFVTNVTTEKDDAAIVMALVAMAHSLGIKVIAEGVETQEQLHFMARHSCDMFQGYYASKPLPPEAFTALLKEGRSFQ